MHRFNIFSFQHKGLKALLYNISQHIQETDFTDPVAAQPVLDMLKEAVHLFKDHNRKEQKHILPLVFEYEPSIWDAFQQEYKKDGLLLQDMESAIRSYGLMESPFDRSFAGKRLSQSFIEFVIFSLEHMSREEQFLNDILWRYYNDLMLLAAHRQMMDTALPETEQYQKWNAVGLEPDAMQLWLEMAESSLPHALYQALVSLSKKEEAPSRTPVIPMNLYSYEHDIAAY